MRLLSRFRVLRRAVEFVLAPRMPQTRYVPRPEEKAALRKIFRAGVSAGIVWVFYRYREEIEQLISTPYPKTWGGIPFVGLATAAAATIGLVFLVAAIRRLRRWLIVHKYRRMLSDPRPCRSRLTAAIASRIAGTREGASAVLERNGRAATWGLRTSCSGSSIAFPIERCLVLVTGTSETTFLEAQIQRARCRMASGSPNEGSRPREVLMAQRWSVTREKSWALAALVQLRLDELAARSGAELTVWMSQGCGWQHD